MERIRTLRLVSIFIIFGILFKGNSCHYTGAIYTERGDIMLGALFAIHKQGSQGGACGEINPITGIMFHEAFRYAINQLNKNKTILFGASLGHTTIDTCMSTIRLKQYLKLLILHYGGAGIVGPMTSDEAVYSSPVLSIFDLNMISYHASSVDLDNRERYDNLFRTVPSDTQQVFAIIDILKRMNWTYVATVNSNGNYGQRGMEYFTNVAKTENLCISKQLILSVEPTMEQYGSVIQDIGSDSLINVIVLITSATDTRGLLKASKNLGIAHGRYIWVGTTAWGTELELTRDIEKQADGAIILSYAGKSHPEFQKYLFDMEMNTSTNPWMPELYELLFNCTRNPKDTVKPQCTGKEKIKDRLGQDFSIPSGLVIKAVNTYACAIRQVILSRCPGTEVNKTKCIFAHPALLSSYQFQEKMLLKALLSSKSSQCSYLNDSIIFEEDGATLGDFNILHLRPNENQQGYSYVKVGHWTTTSNQRIYKKKKNKLTLDEKKLQWPSRFDSNVPISTCSPPCKVDEIKMGDLTRPRCCFRCHKCSNMDLVVNKSSCSRCPNLSIPNAKRTVCKKLPVVGLKMTNSYAVSIILLSTLGVVGVILVTYVFVSQGHKRLVRASGRELCLMILFGIFLCFVAPLLFLIDAEEFVCGMKRIITGLCLTTCYTPLLLKTNRIYRIFTAAQKSIKRPILVSPWSQVAICIGAFAFQLFLGLVWLISDGPKIQRRLINSGTEVVEYCLTNDSSLILYLVISFCLLVGCTYFAFRTRHFPKNYNEAKSIGITLYTTCVLWGIFIPTYVFIKDGDEIFIRTLLAGVFLDVLAWITLVGLFAPKLYVLRMYGDIQLETSTVYTQSDIYSTYTAKTSKIKPEKICQCDAKQTGVSCTTSTSDLSKHEP